MSQEEKRNLSSAARSKLVFPCEEHTSNNTRIGFQKSLGLVFPVLQAIYIIFLVYLCGFEDSKDASVFMIIKDVL